MHPPPQPQNHNAQALILKHKCNQPPNSVETHCPRNPFQNCPSSQFKTQKIQPQNSFPLQADPNLTQDLPLPHHRRRRGLHSYATVSSSSSPTLRTRVDRVGSSNPTWNDKFLFLLPSSPPLPSSSLLIRILSSSPLPLLPDPLLGSVRLLLSNHGLSRTPQFIALGIRRPSGQFHGVLNLGLVVVQHVPGRIRRALETDNAVSYRDLMEVGVLKEAVHLNREVAGSGSKSEEEEEVEKAMRQMCGLGLGMGRMMQIHSSPSDQNLHTSWGSAVDDDDDEKENKR